MAGQIGWNSIKALQSLLLFERGKPLHRHSRRQPSNHRLLNHSKGKARGKLGKGREGWDRAAEGTD